MSSFNQFIELELPRRPFVLEDGFANQLLVRSKNENRSRELVWVDIDQVLDTYNAEQIDEKLDDKADKDHLHDWDEIQSKPEFKISTGNGLDGGGILKDENITINMKEPNTLNGQTSNQLLEDGHTHNIESTDDRDVTNNELILLAKAMYDHINSDDHDYKYPVLNENDLIPDKYMPVGFDGTLFVDTIEDRNNIENPDEGMKVYVYDASDDPNVEDGGAGYMFVGNEWIHIYSEQFLNASQQWDDILNKPEFRIDTGNGLDGGGILKDENITIIMKEPTSLNGQTSNQLLEDGHTHNIESTDDRDVTNNELILLAKAMYDHINSDDHADIYLNVNQNLEDIDDRHKALQNLTNSENGNSYDVLSINSEGGVVWRQIDKYTQSEVDSKLDEKSDKTHNHEDNEIVNTSIVSGENVQEALTSLSDLITTGGKVFVQEDEPELYDSHTLWVVPV